MNFWLTKIYNSYKIHNFVLNIIINYIYIYESLIYYILYNLLNHI